MSFGATTNKSDTNLQLNVTKDNSSEGGASSGTPPPDYERSLAMTTTDKDTDVFHE